MLKIKKAKTETEARNAKVEKAIEELAKQKKIADDANEIVKTQKEIINEFARKELKGSDAQTITFIAKANSVKVSFSYDFKIQDKDKLHAFLGDRFNDLTSEQTEFKPTTKLKEMALKDKSLLKFINVKDKSPAYEVKTL